MASYLNSHHFSARTMRAIYDQVLRLLRILGRTYQSRHHPRLPHHDAHLIRDAAPDANDLARAQHRWPSQTTHHPRG